MEVADRVAKQNPIENAGFFSKHWLVWFWPIFRLGYRRPLTKDDLWDPPVDDKARGNANKLENEWEKQLNSKGSAQPPSDEESVLVKDKDQERDTSEDDYGLLFRALMATFGAKYFSVWPLLFFNDCFLRVIQPWFMLCLIRTFVVDDDAFNPIDIEPGVVTEQYVYAGGVCLSTFMLTLINNPCMFYMGRLGQRCRISLGSLIQRKMVTLKAGNHSTDQGQISNLISNDASYIENNLVNIPYLIIAPLQMIMFMGFLWSEFGWSSFFGLGFILLYMPFQSWNGKLSTVYRKKIGEKTDERARALAEVIDGINSVKMYAWELVFQSILQIKRKDEVRQLKKRSGLHAFQMSIFLTSSRFVPFLTFFAFVLLGGPLTADRVFYAAAVYNTATHFMVFNLPAAIRGIGEIRGSLQRIQRFLMLPERPMNDGHYKKQESETTCKIHLSEVTATWTKNTAPVLSEVKCDFSGNKLILLVGKVGSGKGSILHMIMNELHITSGVVNITGTISYASQNAFIFPGSIRQNILFHNAYDEARYQQVLQDTTLDQDVQRLPSGDGTRAGGLSGGQKARVNLARALYHSSNILLLDDPFSAVDSGVSRKILGALKGINKLKIVATHQTQYLPEADHVIVVDKGRIVSQGNYGNPEVKAAVDIVLGTGNKTHDVDSILKHKPEPAALRIPTLLEAAVDVQDDDENQGEGALGLSIYWKYFKAGQSRSQLFTYFLVFIISQVFTTLIEYWLALWTNAEERMYQDAHDTGVNFQCFVTNLDNLEQHMYMYVYLALTLIVFFTNLAKAMAFFHYCMRICVKVHDRMLMSFFRAKSSFFGTNPPGRIMNRFTKDMSTIDEQIPFAFFDMFTIFLQVATVIFLIVLGIWYSFVAVIVFLAALWYVRKYYVTTSRDLMRITGITRSPVLSHLQSTLNGLVTVRALNAEPSLFTQFDQLQDDNTSATSAYLAATQCFNIWIEVLATVLLTVVAFGFLLAQNYLGMTFLGGNVGLSICSAMSLTIWLQYGMKVSAHVENCMISVERALEYTKLPLEAEWENVGNTKLDPKWPSKGNVSFKNVVLAYNDLGDVLKNLSFDIDLCEKIGIVGRTGAGKSSILQALFRMTELKAGQILIDGVDVGKIGLHELRRNLAIIPQDACVFKGTLGFNLDPRADFDGPKSGGNTDNSEEMKRILRLIRLDKPLNFLVENKGTNLSHGERQLVSLARAIILKRKIVCMDEATAHIDSATDQQIQQTLREHLGNCTVITIAHRLDTVIESDKILVLDHGVKKEYGHPHELLQDADGMLAEMVSLTGPDADMLKGKAKQAFERRSIDRR